MAQKAQTKPAKGTRDFLPADLRRRRYVVDVIRRVYEAHGFSPLETPSFERLDTLLGKYGDEGDQLVFKILHRGQNLVTGIRDAAEHLQNPAHVIVGRSGETAPGAERLLADMGLRYDLTVPLARVYAAHAGRLPSVFRRYQIQPVWRADSPGRGRFREFYQCDVDVVGAAGPTVEAEVVGAVSSCLDELGFESSEIRLNHRGLLRALVEVAGIPLALETAAIVALDKLDKIERAGVAKEMVDKGVEAGAADRLLDIVLGDAALDAVEAALGEHEAGRAACAELRSVLELVEETPGKGKLRFNATLARGLGYYTGCIFEIVHPELSGSLGGGGRYDGLIGMFSGRDVPACGFSIGLERILVVMEEKEMFPPLPDVADVLVGFVTPDRQREAVRLAYALREAGQRVELHPKKDKPGRLRKQALERGFEELVVLGPDPLNPPERSWPRDPDRAAEVVHLPDTKPAGRDG
ncbi:MAG: histidine--tRNA ligase [Myxococcota bacterium]